MDIKRICTLIEERKEELFELLSSLVKINSIPYLSPSLAYTTYAGLSIGLILMPFKSITWSLISELVVRLISLIAHIILQLKE